MDRRIIASGVLVIMVAVFLGMFIVLPPGELPIAFHYEKESAADNEAYLIGIRHVKDCNLTISFVNDSSLLYTIDMEMYGMTDPSTFYFHEDSYSTLLNYYTGPDRTEWNRADIRIKTLDIRLGTGKAYNLAVYGSNYTASITYTNGALIGQETYIDFLAHNSTVDFVYDGYAVDDTTLEEYLNPVKLNVDIGPDQFEDYTLPYVTLEIDLPYFYFGDVDINAGTIIMTMTGWYVSEIHTSYYTEDVEGQPPELFVDAFGVIVEVNMVKALT